jgi:hypothetical protein
VQFAFGSIVLPFYCVPFFRAERENGTPKKNDATLPQAKTTDCVSSVILQICGGLPQTIAPQ